MAVIAVYSVKGGVGKTTMAANLAWCAARISRRKTLLWDLDAAGGAAFLFGMDPPAKDRAADLFGRGVDTAELVRPTGIKKLSILPADASLWSLDGQLAAMGKKKRLAKLAEQMSREYDRIVLDCPPVLNEISRQVIRAADIVIVPMPPSPLSARALDMIRDDIAGSVKRHPPILPVHSMLDLRRGLHKEARAAQPNWPAIPMASAVEQMAVRRAPLGEFAPRSPAMQATRRVWTAIESKLLKG